MEITRDVYSIVVNEENEYDTTEDTVTITVGDEHVTIPFDELDDLLKDLQFVVERW